MSDKAENEQSTPKLSASSDLLAQIDVQKLLVVAYSAGYDAGHHDTVEGQYQGYTRNEHNDHHATEWVEDAVTDGTFNRDLYKG